MKVEYSMSDQCMKRVALAAVVVKSAGLGCAPKQVLRDIVASSLGQYSSTGVHLILLPWPE